MEAQEQECFSERSRLRPDQFYPLNVSREELTSQALDGMHAVMIGGAGEYSATRDYPWTPSLFDVVYRARDRKLPVFGSCWGHQILARAFGGEVIYDGARAELGCGLVELTPEGQRDELFGTLPQRFRVNMGHHDRVSRMPEDAVELAFNASQRFQAFRMADAPIYGTQFHSELDADRERERVIAYRDYYAELAPEDAFQGVLASLADTTDVDHLLHDFVKSFIVDGT